LRRGVLSRGAWRAPLVCTGTCGGVTALGMGWHAIPRWCCAELRVRLWAGRRLGACL